MGGSVAKKFSERGYSIAAMCRKESSFEPTKTILEKAKAKYMFIPCDATDKSSVSSAFEKVRNTLGPVRVLVYNCGGGGFGIEVMDIVPENLIRSFNVSCLGALLCTQQVIPDMLKFDGKKKGTILYSSATSAFRGGAKTGQFACGKHALRALSQSVAKGYGSRGIHACHVRLDCVLATPSYKERFPEMHATDRLASTDDIAETYVSIHEQSPMGWTNEIDIRPYTEAWSC